MSAFLMAVVLRPMSVRERSDLTLAMLASGRSLDLSAVKAPTVDKHSTGGVGDGVSLSLAPLVAACGAAVPMMSGRGLGHTGGTLDKLESIPGFNVFLSPSEIVRTLRRTGAALFGQTEDIVPADKRMYALRDVTATVESLDLITASIMSKKLAEGADALVLDVKTGRGAFMRRTGDALALARSMIAAGHAGGLKVSAFITDMDSPLGNTVGNSLELAEHIALLRGRIGPDGASVRLRELVLTFGAEMLRLTGLVRSTREGRTRIAAAITDGSGLEKFREIVRAQHGDPSVIDKPERLPLSRCRGTIKADADGFVSDLDPFLVGRAAVLLGAGREKTEDKADPGAGFRLLKHAGDRVTRGEPLAEAYASDSRRLKAGTDCFRSAVRIGNRPPLRRRLIIRSLLQ
jgi:pyrimidine-nucleoside phosphorylase